MLRGHKTTPYLILLSRRNVRDGWRTDPSAALAWKKRELAIQKNKQEHFRYLNTFILHHPPKKLSVFYINEKFFVGISSPTLPKRSPERLAVLRDIYTQQRWMWLQHQERWCTITEFVFIRRIQIVEAVACKLFNEVNEASTFPNRFCDLPSHTADVSDHKMKEIDTQKGHVGRERLRHEAPAQPTCYLRWGRGAGTHPWPQSSVGAGSCSRAPAVLPESKRSKRSTSGHSGVLEWGLPAWGPPAQGSAEPLFSPRRPHAWRLELRLGGQRDSGTMHVLTGLRISRARLFSLCGSANIFVPL